MAAVLAVAVVLTLRSGGGGDTPGSTTRPTGATPAHIAPTTAGGTVIVPVTADLVRRDGGAAETTADHLDIGAVVLVVKPAPNRDHSERQSFAALESGDMAGLHVTRSSACG